MEPPQHAPQLHRLGSGDRVGENGDGHRLGQILDALFGDVGIQHDHLAGGQQLLPSGQNLGRQVEVDVHVADGQGHVSVFIVDEKIGGGAPAGNDGGMGGVDAKLRAAGRDLLGVEIVSEHGQKPHVQPKEAHVVGDVASHAAQAHAHGTGIGILSHQGTGGGAADIHVYAAYHRHIRGGADDIALAGNVSFFHQVGNVHRRGGAGDACLVRQLLLGDHGVFLDPVQDLSFPLRHGVTS